MASLRALPCSHTRSHEPSGSSFDASSACLLHLVYGTDELFTRLLICTSMYYVCIRCTGKLQPFQNRSPICGDKPLKFRVVCTQVGTAVLKVSFVCRVHPSRARQNSIPGIPKQSKHGNIDCQTSSLKEAVFADGER